jgi:hypothetical protein
MVKESNKLVRYLNEALKLKVGYERLFIFMVVMLLFCHIMGCFWYLTAKFSDFWPDTWVSRYSY